jgi:hypothetical protein
VSGTSTPAQEIAVPDINTLLDQHVTLVYESVDRVFLNGYVANLRDPDRLASSARRQPLAAPASGAAFSSS